jgi:N-acetylglucosaminyldiphosphoundecaprenol N-acetyl-beta-D-mannosaminyltransferase
MDNLGKSVNILGVRVDRVSLKEATDLILSWLQQPGMGKRYVVTPNVEFIMAAQTDREFKKILNEADLAIPDSARLGWANLELSEKSLGKRFFYWPGFFLPGSLPQPQFPATTGVDLMENLCGHLQDQSLTIGLLGGKDGVAKKAGERLLKRYPKLQISFAVDGPSVDGYGNSLNEFDLLTKTDVLFVAFGQVKQEKWIAKHLKDLPVKVAIGVGGSFDYLSGRVRRAPEKVRNLGLEWLFRLIIQPWRIKRQMSLVRFVWMVTRS